MRLMGRQAPGFRIQPATHRVCPGKVLPAPGHLRNERVVLPGPGVSPPCPERLLGPTSFDAT